MMSIYKTIRIADKEDLLSLVVENLEQGETYYWVTAELEIPAPKEVEAKKTERMNDDT
jgi:hypothetical protein